MSTREYVQTIVNRLTDEQIDELADFIEEKFLPEPPNTAHSIEEIDAMLKEGLDDLRNGRVCSDNEMDGFFRGYCGI